MPSLSSPTALSERVGQFASNFALSQVSKEGVLRAKLSILDSIGVALAATRHDFAHKTLTGLSSMGDRGTAPVIGMPTSLTVRDSMLMNGALIHGVDFDDSHQWGAFHPTSSALTCALGTGHHVGAAGRDVLRLYRRHRGDGSGWRRRLRLFPAAGVPPRNRRSTMRQKIGQAWYKEAVEPFSPS